MLEKLLSLLLHAKGGTLATVLVLGASGALVTATVENGMTTVTITQASPSPDGSAATTPNGSSTTTTTTTTTDTKVDQAILVLFTRTKAEDDPTSTATGNDCSDEAHAMNAEIKAVNAAFKTDRQAVEALSKNAPRTDAAKKLVKDADQAIKDIRQAALKAIHAAMSPSIACDKDDDEDVDEDEDEDNDDEDEDDDNGSTTGATNGTTSTTTAPAVAFSGADPKAIADLAISAMDLQVTNLKATLAALPPNTTNTTKSDSNRSNNDKHDNKGDNKRDNESNNKGKGGDKGGHEDDD